MFEPAKTRTGRRLIFMFGRTDLERLIRDSVAAIEKEAEANAYGQIADLYEAAERLTDAIGHHEAADNPMGDELTAAYTALKKLLNGGPG